MQTIETILTVAIDAVKHTAKAIRFAGEFFGGLFMAAIGCDRY